MDDKQDKAGSDAAKRPPPTIELTASAVSDSAPDETATDTPETELPISDREPSPEAKAPSRTAWAALSALAGAVAALLVIGVATLAGWPPKPAPVSTAPLMEAIATNTADIANLTTRLAKVESDAAKPAQRPGIDPAFVARLDSAEKALASLRSEIAAVRGQSEKTAAAIGEIRAASPQGIVTDESKIPAADTSAIEERIARIERATAALSAATATSAQEPPAEDSRFRRLNALIDLDKAVRRGSPYAAELAAARAVAGDTDALKALDPFAQTGIPDTGVLGKELLALLPQLKPKPDVQPVASSFVERLQQSFTKLVRIQRTDALASGASGAIARATAAAQRNDVNEAKRELLQLPPADLVTVRPWIAKAEGRDKALAASEQFTMDTLTAISKSAR